MRNLIFIVIVFLVAACQPEKQIIYVEKLDLQAQPNAITPIVKPRPNVNSKDYTAPYPAFITEKTSMQSIQQNSESLNAPLVPAGVVYSSPFVPPKKPSLVHRATNIPDEEIKEGEYRTLRRLENDAMHDTRKIRGTIAELIFPEINQIEEKPKRRKQKPAYCYKSLSDSTCYSEPIPGQEFRRVGKLD